ncbi:MAG: response regulator [Beijerinckiaceae bacterium]|nr:response regulator [Beijerinckiaceae bacterium]
MSLAQDIAPHLPFLRRFSRALSGSQQGGDAYVVSTLEAIVADPSCFPTDIDPRVALYQVFLRYWSSLTINSEPVPSAGMETIGSMAERNLEAITPRARQAFLLRVVEGFSVGDIATILRASDADVDALIDTAAQEIARQVATDVLIIEDEPMIALDIESLVQDLGHSVIGIARTHTEAVKIIQEKRPGLILADIQLADGSSGLEAVNEILGSFNVPVIFITAYPERLLTGDRPEPAFLITKPFQTDAVKAAISQALFFDRKTSRKAAA